MVSKNLQQSKPDGSLVLDMSYQSSSSDDVISRNMNQQSFRSFHRRSASVCSLNERFLHRKSALVRESRSNPYIGYFLRHEPDGRCSSPATLFEKRDSRDRARQLKPPPAIKTSFSMSTASAVSTPSTRSVRFSKTVHHSSIVMTHWDGDRKEDEDVYLSIINRKRSLLRFFANSN